MASQLKVDTLTGVTTAGSIVVTGEGNSTTTNLQQGLAKTWIRFNQTSTPAIANSFNIASIVDGGTGDTTLTITNDYANVNYAISASNDDTAVSNQIVADDVFVGSYRQRSVDGNNSLVDSPICYTATHGDLA
jgi:hypothetical protein